MKFQNSRRIEMDEQIAWSTVIALGALALIGLGILTGVLVALFRQLSRDKLIRNF